MLFFVSFFKYILYFFITNNKYKDITNLVTLSFVPNVTRVDPRRLSRPQNH